MQTCCNLKTSLCFFSLNNFCTFEAGFLHVSIDLRPLYCLFLLFRYQFSSLLLHSLSLSFYCFVTFKYTIILHRFHLPSCPFRLSAALEVLFPASVTPLARKKLTSILISTAVQSYFCHSGVTNPIALSCWSNELRSATAACSHSAH